MKKVYVLIGNFGSGKTEISLNLAVKARARGSSVLVDLDVINPYFRSAERKDILDEAGVKLYHPIFALTTVDVPSLPPDIYSVFIDDHETVVFDVGGDPAGATALGQYKANFDALPEGSLEVLYVVNPRRPFSAEADMVLDLMERINYRSRLKVTGLVNNANLAKETAAQDILEGYDMIREVSMRSGVPVAMTAGMAEPLNAFLKEAAARGLSDEWIGAPFEITTYMHRDWETFTEKGI